MKVIVSHGYYTEEYTFIGEREPTFESMKRHGEVVEIEEAEYRFIKKALRHFDYAMERINQLENKALVSNRIHPRE